MRAVRVLVVACVGCLSIAAFAEGKAPVPGPVPVPASGRPVDTSHATRVVGHGTPAGCTSAAVVAAVRAGGIIRFSCGPKPVTIRMNATAKVVNTSPEVVLDGGGLVTLSGEGRRRILYMDTCDPAQTWTTSHCQDQATPRLVVQNLTLTGGNSTGQDFDGGGGGAIFDRGGRLRIVDSVFTDNRCERDGPDIGGAAVRALSQSRNLPVYVTGSRFTGNACSNGAALSSIGVSWTVLNDRFTDNRAIGNGANPAGPGTPGGGSGGAIYNDGDRMQLTIAGCVFTHNHANDGGGAIFFVSDDRSGTMSISDSTLEANPNDGFHTRALPGIFFLGARPPTITDSVIR
jgi:Chlamydia polymorphic membrane protein (Chlamydia_PMP) repeat